VVPSTVPRPRASLARGAQLVAAVALLLGSTVARADDSAPPAAAIVADPPREGPPPSRLELWLGGMTIAPSLLDARFSGAGTSLSGPMSVDHTGRQLGLGAPAFYGGEVGLAYRHTYFAAGVTGFLAGAFGRPDAKPTDPYVAGLASPGSPIAYGAAIELLAAMPLGRVTASVGGVAGVRAFQVPLHGFEPAQCRERGKSFACSTDATTGALPFVQPRVRLDVALDDAQAFFVGGYLGVDVLGAASPSAGLMLGVRTASLRF
jgi:hypothetical protein